MTQFALFVRLDAKPGQEDAVADFLAGALPLANAAALLGTPPNIEKIDRLAAKWPG